MSIDGSSDVSEELGEPYDRIEYPREVYDRVCGRTLDNDPPLANEKKVDDWLSDTQASQETVDINEVSLKEVYDSACGKKLDDDPPLANEEKVDDWLPNKHESQKADDISQVSPMEVSDSACGEQLNDDPPLANEEKVEDSPSDTQALQKSDDISEVSPKDRKRKKKEMHDDGSVPSADSSYKSAKTGTKKSRHSLKRMRDYDSEEESSDNLYTYEDDEYSEVESSPQKKGKKKKRTDSTMQQNEKTREDMMKEKKRARIEEEEKEKIEPQKTKHGKGEKNHPIRTEKKERKDVNNERSDQLEDGEEGGDKLNSKHEENIEKKKKKKKKDNGEKVKPPKINKDMGEKLNSKREERKEKNQTESKKKRVSSSDTKNSSNESRKSESRERVYSPSNQFLLALSGSSKSSRVPPSRRKSIVKKRGAQTKASPSDDSVLPSCMQELFKDSPAPAPSSSSSSKESSVPSASSSLSKESSAPAASPSLSNSAFKIPKKKNASDRQGKRKCGPVELTLEERGEGLPGWDPRSIAFVPPRRKFGKPPPKPPMEKEEKVFNVNPVLLLTNGQKEDIVYNNFIRSGKFQYEEWWESVDWSRMLSTATRTHTTLVPSAGGETASTSLSQKRLDQWGTEGTASSSHQKSSDGGTPDDHPVTSSSLYPTPRRTAEGENDHAMVDFESMRSPFNSTASSESAEKEDFRLKQFTPSIEEGKKKYRPRYPRGEGPFVDYSDVEEMRRFINEERAREEERARAAAAAAPPSSTSACRRLVFEPHPKPDSSEKLIPYRAFLIDDECLIESRKSYRFKKYGAMAVAGPFTHHMDKRLFESLMKERGADVAWTKAPPTKNEVAKLKGRTIAVILCQDPAKAEEIAEERMIRVKDSTIQTGIPREVLFKLEGVITKTINEEDLMEELTDAIEAQFGELVELLFFPTKEDFAIEGKARFFHSVNVNRALFIQSLPLSGGREITFSDCPREKSTKFIIALISDSPVTCGEEKLKKWNNPVPAIIPTSESHGPQPVPPPSLVSLSTIARTIKMEPGTSLPNTTTVCSPSSPTPSQCSSREEMDMPGLFSRASTRLSSLPKIGDFMAIPPPGLIVSPRLLTPTMDSLVGKTLSIPSLSVPAGVIPMPPQPIPPPTDIVPILPYPDFPSTDHYFFAAPPPRARRSGGAERGRLLNIDPSTFIRPFSSLLPKREEFEEEEEILLFARPQSTESQEKEKIDWDAVRAYFKDEDCSSRVYGGIVSLRYTGEKAKEKGQMLMLNSPHSVNGQTFSIGNTYPVLYEASRAVGKTRLYEEIMEKFGSVVEVEKKCDSPSGKPVYKIYFDSLEKAQAAAVEGIRVGESTLENMGTIPSE